MFEEATHPVARRIMVESAVCDDCRNSLEEVIDNCVVRLVRGLQDDLASQGKSSELLQHLKNPQTVDERGQLMIERALAIFKEYEHGKVCCEDCFNRFLYAKTEGKVEKLNEVVEAACTLIKTHHIRLVDDQTIAFGTTGLEFNFLTD